MVFNILGKHRNFALNQVFVYYNTTRFSNVKQLGAGFRPMSHRSTQNTLDMFHFYQDS